MESSNHNLLDLHKSDRLCIERIFICFELSGFMIREVAFREIPSWVYNGNSSWQLDGGGGGGGRGVQQVVGSCSTPPSLSLSQRPRPPASILLHLYTVGVRYVMIAHGLSVGKSPTPTPTPALSRSPGELWVLLWEGASTEGVRSRSDRSSSRVGLWKCREGSLRSLKRVMWSEIFEES